MSRSRQKLAVVYTLYGACMQMFVLILCDPKGSRPDRTCEVCRVGRCGMRHTIITAADKALVQLEATVLVPCTSASCGYETVSVPQGRAYQLKFLF